MRWCIFAACVFGFSSSGCFNPKIKSGGFACSTADPTPCPSGFYCVNGLCQDHPGGGAGGAGGVGGNGDPDMAMSTGDMSNIVAGNDLSSTGGAPDLSQPPVQDMATTPPDMVKCAAPGTFCLSGSGCCSKSCTLFTCD